MSSFQQGFDTATLELMSGYPAYFYEPDDGGNICGFDDQFGLPIRRAGDCGPNINWLIGFNRGVLANIELFGLPWNSRSTSLNILKDPCDYFNAESVQRGFNKLFLSSAKILQPKYTALTACIGSGIK